MEPGAGKDLRQWRRHSFEICGQSLCRVRAIGIEVLQFLKRRRIRSDVGKEDSWTKHVGRTWFGRGPWNGRRFLTGRRNPPTGGPTRARKNSTILQNHLTAPAPRRPGSGENAAAPHIPVPEALAVVMVEAGGVEPPSEKARRKEPTCVAGSKFSAAASEPARAAVA